MSYIINITRNGTSGRLRYNHGGVSVNTTCWWDPDVVVDAGTYQGYATRMPSKADGRKGKKREGIWFGKGVPVNGGRKKLNGIFIHKGTNASWSDGCVVIRKDLVEQIWDSIDPKETRNIEIRISDPVKRVKRASDRHCTRR